MPFDRLPWLAEEWHVVDFFAVIPKQAHGSLLSALNRSKVRACLVELPDLGLPMLLLMMRSAVAWLELESGTRRALAGQAVRDGNSWILALMPGTGGDFPSGALELTEEGLRIGTGGSRLKPMPPFRPWSWRWNPTCGSGSFAVYVDRTEHQIREWLSGNPYLDPARTIGVTEGALSFSTSQYRGLSRQQAGCDHAILAPLSQGALGELSFDLIDTDYGTLRATGHSCAELAAYLDPVHFWQADRYRLTVRLKPDEEPRETIRLAMIEYRGLAAACGLQEILHGTPIANLPRWLTVEIPLRMMPVDLNPPVAWNHRIRLESSTRE